MRYSCDEPGLEGNFVEYSDVWSRGEVRQAYKAVGEEFFDLLKRKMTALHLDAIEGEALTDPANLTEADLDRVDMRIFAWFSVTWVAHLNALADLGNALGRKLFTSSATSKVATTDAPRLPMN